MLILWRYSIRSDQEEDAVVKINGVRIRDLSANIPKHFNF